MTAAAAIVSIGHGQWRHRDEVELTILMPCLNEAETIAVCIEKAKRFLERNSISGEVLIADNGSTDGSIAIAESLGARVVPIRTRGYGAALGGGIAAAKGTYVIMGDADDSYDLENLEPFLEKLRGGADLVMGNRFRGGIAPDAMPFLHRYLGNPVLSFLGRLFFDIPVGDFHCGLRGFRRTAIAGLGLETTGMEFASEMIVRASLDKLTITEVPTTLKPDGRSRPPHLRTWRDGWRHLKFLLIFCPRWLYFVPGLALFGVGALLSLGLLAGPMVVGNGVELDLSSFLAACLMTVLGSQILTFGVLARYFATRSGMLPSASEAQWLTAVCKTDRFVTAAAVMLAVGMALFAVALSRWANADFGPLADPHVPRFVAGGMSLVVIGLQTAFAGFMFGIVDSGLSRRAQPRVAS